MTYGWAIVETVDADNPDQGDLMRSGRSLVRIGSFSERVAQSVRVHFRWWRAEWFLDTRRGVPYLEELLGHTATNAVIQALVRREALRVSGVASVSRISIERDAVNRRTTVDLEILTTEGEKIPVTSVPLGRA